MKPTADEILTVLNEIGKSLSVRGVHSGGCHTYVLLSNGWWLRIFDEGSGDYDYIESVEIDGKEISLWKDESGKDCYDQYTAIHDHWSPTPEQLKLMSLK